MRAINTFRPLIAGEPDADKVGKVAQVMADILNENEKNRSFKIKPITLMCAIAGHLVYDNRGLICGEVSKIVAFLSLAQGVFIWDNDCDKIIGNHWEEFLSRSLQASAT